MTIIGQNPRGAMYGCYEILKRHCGVRWLVPGPDGEYFAPKKTVTVPLGRSVCNPYLPVRTFGGIRSDELHEWCARNNMEGVESSGHFVPEDEFSTKRRDRL